MRRILAVLAGIVMVASTALAAAPGAQAADGYFYAYADSNFGGQSCGWSRDSFDWGPCKNRASSVWNNGHVETYDKVQMFWGSNHAGASYCVAVGVRIANLAPYRFNPPGSGSGETLNDNVASHRWVRSNAC